jgi:hypothetical protein
MARRPNDAYYTEKAVTLELLKHLTLPPDATFIEPCNGRGNISSAIEEKYDTLSMYRNDIDTTIEGLDGYEDASDPKSSLWINGNRQYKYDISITNPPYNKANDIVPLVYKHCTLTAVLMRLSWLEPTKDRQEFLQLAQPHLALIGILNPRPRYGSSGTDNVTSSWLVWDKNKLPQTETKVIFMDNWQHNV